MLPSAVLALSLLVPSFALAQQPLEHASPAVAHEDLRVPTVLEGFVLAPDGAPAEGAVVLSSAGGQAVTDHAGNFRLELSLPLDAESLQLTAVGQGGNGLVASSRVPLTAASAWVHVGPLLLSSTSCSPGWLPTFGSEPWTDTVVNALAVFDDGSGPALYAGVSFTGIGLQGSVARWDGSSWSFLGGTGGSGATGVYSLAVHDDGGGPALYAGGAFSALGGVRAKSIARWNGSSWSALGSGVDRSVRALAVFDDGGGPELYAGGYFTTAGGSAANHIARWNGSSWSPARGMNDVVLALAVFDDGGGPALYAGGNFTTAGGYRANRIARWDGASWSPLGSGMVSSPSSLVSVRALTVFDDGGGPALYAGGDFTSAGGAAAKNIARWNGSSWSPLGSGMNSSVYSLTVFDDGGGPALHAGGWFTSAGGNPANRIARWDGASWSALGSGMDQTVYALSSFDDGGGPALFAGGDFFRAEELYATAIARWNGSSWSVPGIGLSSGVSALAVFDDGGGPALFAGGGFRTAGGVLVRKRPGAGPCMT